MKKHTLVILTLALIFVIAGCGSKKNTSSNSLESNTEASSAEASSSNGDINLDKLNDAVDSINNLDLGPGSNDNNSTTEATSDNNSTSTAGNTVSIYTPSMYLWKNKKVDTTVGISLPYGATSYKVLNKRAYLDY